IINGLRLVDIGEYVVLANQEKTECIPFQAAADQQRAGNFGAALVAYSDIISSYHGGALAEAALLRSVFLFEHVESSALVNQDVCRKIETFLVQGLMPQR